MSDLRPMPFEAAPGITGIDTVTGGNREFNSVYVIGGTEPTLVEAASGADAPLLIDGLASLGIGPPDLAHIVVTHVHLDHAGGVGALARHFPRATVWVHERGAPHLVDPSRLVASTARTYGPERMQALYGTTLPTLAERIIAVSGGESIPAGDRSLEVLYTPGHASHHVALVDAVYGHVFTGEAIGSHLPWADCYRPALPPPEVDLELALAGIERIRERARGVLLTSHFGPIADPQEGCDRGAERIRAWSETVRAALLADPAAELGTITAALTEQASREYMADAGTPIDLARYDAIGSIGMNAAGIARYWRKRWEAEAAAVAGS
jgi:glyoxylase-like metal-dependent hydrolase (beta-lactamase superfamily II)